MINTCETRLVLRPICWLLMISVFVAVTCGTMLSALIVPADEPYWDWISYYVSFVCTCAALSSVIGVLALVSALAGIRIVSGRRAWTSMRMNRRSCTAAFAMASVSIGWSHLYMLNAMDDPLFGMHTRPQVPEIMSSAAAVGGSIAMGAIIWCVDAFVAVRVVALVARTIKADTGCRNCGYPLDGTIIRCPECGAVRCIATKTQGEISPQEDPCLTASDQAGRT